MDDADRTPRLGVATDESMVSRMYRVAEEVIGRRQAAEWRACETEAGGPVYEVKKRVFELETDMKQIATELAEARGQSKRDMVLLKWVSAVILACTLGIGALSLVRSAHPAQDEIVRELRAMRAELPR